MIKPVSTLSIIVAGVMCIVPTFGAQMTPQIQRLLDQKQEKIKKLEECEGKKQGWMIAGISTIGVTAVGVGLNIAQASKRNRLDDEIDTARHDLEKKREDLSSIQNQIAEKEREKAEQKKEEEKYAMDVSVDGTVYCFYDIDGNYKDEMLCTVNNPGDWAVEFSYGTVYGVSACSDLSGDYATVATDQDRVESAYKNSPITEPVGENCYCKMTLPDELRWVSNGAYGSTSDCAAGCAFSCARNVELSPDFRGAVFGSLAN